MEIETDTMIQEATTEEVVEIIRGFKGKIDKVLIKGGNKTEEKKTLSDKICNAYKMGTKDVIHWADVKETIKDIKKEIDAVTKIVTGRPDWKIEANDIINKRVGKKLYS